VTHRANSVFAIPFGRVEPVRAADVAAWIEAAERFYRERQLLPAFQIAPGVWPLDLDALLESRGYTPRHPSEVWTAAAEEVPLDACTSGDPGELVLTKDPDIAWFDCAYGEPTQQRQVREGIVARVDRPCLFASIRRGDVAVACGLGVSDDGWVGIFSMATRPEHRGRGLARRILGALAAWAIERGDDHLYLQVTATNTAARTLYQRAGFRRAYAYCHRVGGAWTPPNPPGRRA
jgi:ribosomal protein S18 acetylase RimI-like enzyme